MNVQDENTRIEQIANVVLQSALTVDRRSKLVVVGMTIAIAHVAKRYGWTLTKLVEQIQRSWGAVPEPTVVKPINSVSNEEFDDIMRQHGREPFPKA